LATNAGIYSGMIKHNLVKSLSNAFSMSALSFVEMLQLRETLEKYCDQTKKDSLDYFNLIKHNEIQGNSSFMDSRATTIMTPFSSCNDLGKNSQL
jgi:hypothetical protein